jgi:hypothetical protein
MNPSKIEYLYNIYLKIIQYNIETINYKNKNPQVNLMGSNPFSIFGKLSVVIKIFYNIRFFTDKIDQWIVNKECIWKSKSKLVCMKTF